MKTYKCKVCGETKTETISATGKHNWINGTITKQPTCTENGTKTWTCSVCGKIGTDTLKATGSHSWETVSGKAPTKTAAGYTDYKKCKACGAVTGKSTRTLKAGSWSSWTTTVYSETSTRDVETKSESTPVYTKYYCYKTYKYIGQNGNWWYAPYDFSKNSNYLRSGQWITNESTTPLDYAGSWNGYKYYGHYWYNQTIENRQTGTSTTVYYRYRDYTE